MSRTGHSLREAPGTHVVAHAPVRDGLPAADQNFAGVVIKQQTPVLDTARADLDLVLANERYFLWHTGEADLAIPAGIGTPTKGLALYIDKTTNALVLAATALTNGVLGDNFAKFGRVSYVGPERGLTTDLFTVNLDKAAGLRG